ncbi:MAG: XRE family transcriptional regulator [Acinetobacter sp.]|nr:XRE family transcriptional regulator [Acinetobacter sp.]
MTTYKSVFDAISDTPLQAANLKLRAELMQHLQQRIKQMNGSQREIAQQCGITQPRLNDLLQGKMSKFSLDALVNINAQLGEEIELVFV